VIALPSPVPFAVFGRQLLRCRDCRELFGFEPKPLQWGKPSAPIVIVGQAPSKSSSECGRPFSKDLNTPNGSGRRLMRWLSIGDHVFYDPKKVYVTGVAHCYPGKGGNGDKRPPKYCADKWLSRELAYLKPNLFIVVGKYAADYLSEHHKSLEGRSFEDLVFKDQRLYETPTVFLPHPSGANQKWIKDHSDFEASRLAQIRSRIDLALT
jgi:uracil-DNA glycosylase family 4